MHTVEILEEAVRTAEQVGYRVRQEWLGGTGGGACEIKGRKSLFLDLAETPSEQLARVLDTLRREPNVSTAPISSTLRDLIKASKAA